MLMKLKKDGMTLVMVTHDPTLKNLADRVVYMRDGKIARIEMINSKVSSQTRNNLSAALHVNQYIHISTCCN
jgi:ABC-type lipoprotein export system ATPase subunit